MLKFWKLMKYPKILSDMNLMKEIQMGKHLKLLIEMMIY